MLWISPNTDARVECKIVVIEHVPILQHWYQLYINVHDCFVKFALQWKLVYRNMQRKVIQITQTNKSYSIIKHFMLVCVSSEMQVLILCWFWKLVVSVHPLLPTIKTHLHRAENTKNSVLFKIVHKYLKSKFPPSLVLHQFLKRFYCST